MTSSVRRLQAAGPPAERVEVSSPLLAAVLIVKDEAGMLPACLASLAGVVDEIHVYDTGLPGHWDDDFAAARNRAVAGCDATWVLAVDADHRVTADPSALREFLAATPADTVLVEVDDDHHSDPYRQWETRIYRPAAVAWSGRVHERLVRPDGSAPVQARMPGAVLRLRHVGYATLPDRIRRAERNLALGHRMLDELGGAGDRERIAATLLAIGRDCAAAQRWQQAVDTFEALRELFPGTPEWVQATDGLARVVLASGYDKACLVLVEDLRTAGAPPAYCDWLAAQALAQLGDPHEAARLLAGVTEVVDTAGRRRETTALRELTALVDRLRVLAPRP
jgi:hypothetical protein